MGRTTGHTDFAGQIVPGTPFLITPDDDNNLQAYGVTKATRAISFAVAGTLSIVDVDGNTIVIPANALAAGQMHAIYVRRVNSTGTTATGIVGYF